MCMVWCLMWSKERASQGICKCRNLMQMPITKTIEHSLSLGMQECTECLWPSERPQEWIKELTCF